MRSNRLQNNADKADVLWCATGRRQHQLPTSGLVVDGALVSSSASVPDLGVLLDADLSMRSQVHMTVSKCFWTIRQLRSIRRSLTVFKSVVAALVNGRLDYCNSVLTGLPVYLLRRLQSVQNAAARLIFRVPDVFMALYLSYLAQMSTCTSAVSACRHLRSSSAAIVSGSDRLCAPTFRLVTVGGRAFDVVDASVRNSLPADITSADTISAFRRRLKTFLLGRSFPDIDINIYRLLF
jgi:hypothetical protein